MTTKITIKYKNKTYSMLSDLYRDKCRPDISYVAFYARIKRYGISKEGVYKSLNSPLLCAGRRTKGEVSRAEEKIIKAKEVDKNIKLALKNLIDTERKDKLEAMLNGVKTPILWAATRYTL